MEKYEYFILPTTQLPPFDVNTPYPTEIAGIKFDSYIDWMKSCWYISATANPAASVPAGFTPDGLPVGIQIVGRNKDDFSVLQVAHAFEMATGVGRRRRISPSTRRTQANSVSLPMQFPNITRFLTGVAIPVSALRSRSSCGIGEFPDLVLLGEWCLRTGLDLIQILPVNDSGLDASPYNAHSAFALNPIMCDWRTYRDRKSAVTIFAMREVASRRLKGCSIPAC
jgi:hypothetical protein